MVTLTISPDRRVTADGRLFGNAKEAVTIAGLPADADATEVRLYVVAPQGVVAAYQNGFRPANEAGVATGVISMNTTAMESVLAYVVEGRFVNLAVVITDSADTTYGSGFVCVVKAPAITAPIQLEAATIAEIKAILNALGDSEEPDNEHELWEKTRQAAADVAERL